MIIDFAYPMSVQLWLRLMKSLDTFDGASASNNKKKKKTCTLDYAPSISRQPRPKRTHIAMRERERNYWL